MELLDLTTVFIIAVGEAGPSIGSGFFIAPNTIMTNGHVVENARAGEIYVTNRALGSLKQVSVAATRDWSTGNWKPIHSRRQPSNRRRHRLPMKKQTTTKQSTKQTPTTQKPRQRKWK